MAAEPTSLLYNVRGPTSAYPAVEISWMVSAHRFVSCHLEARR